MAMSRSNPLNKKFLGVLALALVLAAAVVVWMERTPLLAWFYVRKLAQASEADRGVWVERVAGLGEAPVDHLLAWLSDPSPPCCANARAALEKLTGRWGPGDPRTIALAHRCGREFQRMSPAGQCNVLELAAAWFVNGAGDPAALAGLVAPSSRLLAEAVATKDGEVQVRGLDLCAILIQQPQANDALSSSRELVSACLGCGGPSFRVRALRMTLQPGLDLSEQVVPLLADPVAEVRRAALMAVSLDDSVLDDVLLPCLHDSDEEVRAQCKVVLANRGRTPQQIKLGRLLTHPDPVERMKVLKLLRDEPELDPTVWLQRLSHDPSPAIRIAAVRVMVEDLPAPPSERISEMAQSDPSESVAWVAQCYLQRIQHR
jgi:hypothetical protein